MRRLTTVLACFALAGAALAGCGDDEGNDANDAAGGKLNPPADTTPADTAGGSPASGKAVQISMVDILYKPETANVKVGQEVVWTNDDPIAHTVTATSGADFDSGSVDSGGTFEYTPEKAGTIEYFCEIHPNQKGKLIVE